ncbi:MAG: hypothetical protein M3155_02445 [Actinomycetota bacterium]|nr:hypothetical protein [Actinomycetota bacterium]
MPDPGAGGRSGASLLRLQSLVRDLLEDVAAVRERVAGLSAQAAARERDSNEQLDAVCRELEEARSELSSMLEDDPSEGADSPGLGRGELGAAFRAARHRPGTRRPRLDDIVPPAPEGPDPEDPG